MLTFKTVALILHVYFPATGITETYIADSGLSVSDCLAYADFFNRGTTPRETYTCEPEIAGGN